MKELTLTLLKNAGWSIDRDITDQVEIWIKLWEEHGLVYPLQAKNILLNFGGIILEQTYGWFFKCYFNPANEALDEEYLFTRHMDKIGSKLYPLAEIDDSYYYLCVDERGQIYSVGDVLFWHADSIDEYLDLIAGNTKEFFEKRKLLIKV